MHDVHQDDKSSERKEGRQEMIEQQIMSEDL